MRKTTDEVWKDVVGYEGLYKVSNFGRVKSCERVVIRGNGRPINFPEKIMKPSVNHKGYLIIDLRKKGTRKGGFVHRLVAKAFIRNPLSKEQVNHENGKRDDNHVGNLKWATNQENMEHAYKILGRTNKAANNARRRKVDQLDNEGLIMKSFDSLDDAVRETGINNISAVCRGVRPSAGGYKWRYSTGKGSDSHVSK